MALPISVQAANVTRTLQPGRTYTFAGTDARVISHITVTGSTRYQYVAINGRGDVTSYGFSIGRVSVNGDGRTLITPTAPMQVSFNAARLHLTHTTGYALRQISLLPNQTIILQGTSTDSRHIRTNRGAGFDLVITNAAGAHTMHRDVRFPQMNLPAGGELTLTALDGALAVYFPELWLGQAVQSRMVAGPAIVTVPISQPFVLSHEEERAITIDIEPLHTAAEFAYEFITRDRHGFAVGHGESTGNRITIAPNRTLAITPLMDAEIIMPGAIAQLLTISQGTDAPAHYLLQPGQSLLVENHDAQRYYAVYFTSEPGGYTVIFDYTLETEDGITFGIEVSSGRMEIPPGGRLLVTAGTPASWIPQTLAVRFAYSPAITFARTAPMLVRHDLDENASIIFGNDGDEPLEILIRMLAANGTFDYVRTDVYGTVAAFGTRATTTWEVEPGETLHLTRTGEALTIAFPQTLYEAGLTAAATDEPALIRRALEANEPIRIDNINNRYHVAIHINSPFDYALQNTQQVLLAYGMQAAGQFNLRYQSRLTLLAPADAYVTFPAVWQPRIRFQDAANPPLHRITLRPGEFILLRNNTANTITIDNNSRPNGAAFTLRAGTTISDPQYGLIYIPPNATLTLTAARGANLQLWLPFVRARQLRLV